MTNERYVRITIKFSDSEWAEQETFYYSEIDHIIGSVFRWLLTWLK